MNIVIYLTQWQAPVNNSTSPALPADTTAFVDVTGQQTIIPDPNAVMCAVVVTDAQLTALDGDLILISEPFDADTYGDWMAQIRSMLDG